MTYDFLFSTACLFSCLKVNNSWWSLWDWPIRVHKKHYSPVHYTVNYYIDTDEIPGFFLFTFFPSCAVKILFLSVKCEDIGVAMVTNMISQLQEILKFHCLLCRNFISIYKINRSLHDHLEIWILSSRAESLTSEWSERVRYFQHLKIKFVSMRSHVISSIYSILVVSVKKEWHTCFQSRV